MTAKKVVKTITVDIENMKVKERPKVRELVPLQEGWHRIDDDFDKHIRVNKASINYPDSKEGREGFWIIECLDIDGDISRVITCKEFVVESGQTESVVKGDSKGCTVSVSLFLRTTGVIRYRV